MKDPADELREKDERIDDLVAQAAKLVEDLSLTVADMKAILSVAAANVEAQKRISEEERDGGTES